MSSHKQQIKKFWWKNSGYTTIELLIAMQLTFMIIGLAYSSYLFSRNLVKKWQDKIAIEAQLAVLSKTLSQHLWQIRQILQADASHILALEISGDSLQLRLDEHLYINEDSLVISPLKLRKGKLIYFLPSGISGEIIQRSGQIDLQETSNIAAVQLELYLSYHDREYPFILCCRLLRIRPVIDSE
jgi:hypothetical protein